MSEKSKIQWRACGKSIASNGYMLVRVGKGHHLADVRGYAYEHRLVAEEKLGRRLVKGEIPHHINGIKSDNRPENLEVTKSIAHHMIHHRKANSNRKLVDETNPLIQCGCGCGESFNKFDGSGRPRKFITGHNPPDDSKQQAFIAACGSGSSLTEIAGRTGQTTIAVKVMASNLVRAGKLQRKGRGIYGR